MLSVSIIPHRVNWYPPSHPLTYSHRLLPHYLGLRTSSWDSTSTTSLPSSIVGTESHRIRRSIANGRVGRVRNLRAQSVG
jgi:hypothetical protein